MAIPTSPHARYLASDLSGTHDDGDPVATWPDASGNGRDASQATAADQPVFRAATFELAEHPSVDFLNVGMRVLLSAAFGSTIAPATWGAVVSLPSILSGNRVLLDGDSGRNAVFYDGSALWTIFAGTLLTSGTAATTGVHTLIAVFDGASSALYVDGTEVVSGDAGAQALDRVVLGAEADGTDDPDVEMVEVLLYDRALDATERSDLLDYFDTTYLGGGTTPAEGSVALSLGLDLAVTGARESAGTAAYGIGLGLAVTGARPSSGEVHFTLGLGLAAVGMSREVEPAPPAQTYMVPAETRRTTISREVRRVDVPA